MNEKQALKIVIDAALKHAQQYSINANIVQMDRSASEQMKRDADKYAELVQAAKFGDFCGNCREPWPCDCIDPIRFCGICAGSLAGECKCSERYL